MEVESTQATTAKASAIAKILVAGRHSAGKTSLIQAVTHCNTVSEEDIGSNAAPQAYETAIANFIETEEDGLSGQDADCIWHCIDGLIACIRNDEAAKIKNLPGNAMLVVTKCELIGKEHSEAVIGSLLDILPRERIVLVSAKNKRGLKTLIRKTSELLGRQSPQFANFDISIGEYYANIFQAWENNMESEINDYINWGASRAAAIALIPLPMADAAPLIANEAYMIYKLAEVHGIAIDKSILSMLLGCACNSIAGKIGANFLPFMKIPIAAAATYGIGKTAKAYFESGMTLSLDELKQKFASAQTEGKAKNWNPME